MNVTSISSESASKAFSSSNVVTGIIEDQSMLTAFIDELHSNGVMAVEILQGEEGLSFLEQQEHSIRGLVDFFLADMETDMRRLYASEIRLGRVVFGVPVSLADKERVIQVAKNHHATAITFYGRFMNETIESTPADRQATMVAITQASSGTSL